MPKKARCGGAMWNGVNYYVGSKAVLPSGFNQFATRTVAYKVGRRNGFAAGILKGIDEGVKRGIQKAKVVKALSGWIRKVDITPNISQRALQSIAQHLNMPNYSQTKAQLYPRVIAHPWVRVKATDVLLQ
jgi:hypothetical protein